ncbi:MAG: hypothetical protein R3194_13035, partial [Limnobacter sp.]|nr:hypothetical protein [Limnobacter sp.]
MKRQLRTKVAVAVAGVLLGQAGWAQERSVQVQQRRITPAMAATMSIEQQAQARFVQMLRTNPEIG